MCAMKQLINVNKMSAAPTRLINVKQLYEDIIIIKKIQKLHLTIDTFYDTNCPKYVTISHRWDNYFSESVKEMPPFVKHICDRSNHKPCNKCYICDLHTVLPIENRLRIFQYLLYLQSIGHKYVWADMFCINQSNQNDKILQINNMAKHYKNSDVTYCFLNGFMTLPDMTFPVLDWFERGWIVQEMYLSRSLIKVVTLGGDKMVSLVKLYFNPVAINQGTFDETSINTDDVLLMQKIKEIHDDIDSGYKQMIDVDFFGYILLEKAINNYRIKSKEFRKISKINEKLEKYYLNGPERKIVSNMCDYYGFSNITNKDINILSFCAAINMINDKKYTYETDRLLSIVSIVDESIAQIILDGVQNEIPTQHIYKQIVKHEFTDENKRKDYLLHSLSYGGTLNIDSIKWAQSLDGAIRNASSLLLEIAFMKKMEYVKCNMTSDGLELPCYNGTININQSANVNTFDNLVVIMDVIREGTSHRYLVLNINDGTLKLLNRDLPFDILHNEIILSLHMLAEAGKIYWESDDNVDTKCKNATTKAHQIAEFINQLFKHENNVATICYTNDYNFGMLVLPTKNGLKQKVGTVVFKKDILKCNNKIYTVI